MKKTVFLLSTLLLTSSTCFAIQQNNQEAQQPSSSQNHTFIQSVKDGWNSFIDVLAGKGSRYSATNPKTTQLTNENKSSNVNSQAQASTTQPANSSPKPATTNTKPQGNTKSDDSGSVYDSVRSGWNSFIDVLTGTK